MAGIEACINQAFNHAFTCVTSDQSVKSPCWILLFLWPEYVALARISRLDGFSWSPTFESQPV